MQLYNYVTYLWKLYIISSSDASGSSRYFICGRIIPRRMIF